MRDHHLPYRPSESRHRRSQAVVDTGVVSDSVTRTGVWVKNGRVDVTLGGRYEKSF